MRTKGVRDLRDDTWMLRETIAEIERDQHLRRCPPYERYEISQIPYLGSDGKAREGDVPTRKIYVDDTDYIKRCKRGGDKTLIWWRADTEEEDKPYQLVRPKPVDWSVHPESLLPSHHEYWKKNRKLVTTRPVERKETRLQPHKLPPAVGAPKNYTSEWEPALRKEQYNFDQILKHAYMQPAVMERKRRRYLDSLHSRPHNEEEKLALQTFLEARARNEVVRTRTGRFDRLSRGLASWTTEERDATVKFLFPHGWGRGTRPPIVPVPKAKAHDFS